MCNSFGLGVNVKLVEWLVRGCLGHQDWGYLGRSKFYAHQEKGVFFKKKKVLKLIWGKKFHFLLFLHTPQSYILNYTYKK